MPTHVDRAQEPLIEVQSAGTLVGLRRRLNFPSSATVADDAANDRVNVTPAGGVTDHANLTNVTADQHHAQSHTHASHTSIGANDHHNQAHVLATTTALGGDHTTSGTADGQVLRASGATTAAFAQLGHGDLGSVTANQHHNQAHVVTSTDHTVSGLTTDNVLRATGATTFAWGLEPAIDLVTTKGDLLVASAADALARLAVGSDTQVLTADSTATNGVKWAAGGSAAGYREESTPANAATTVVLANTPTTLLGVARNGVTQFYTTHYTLSAATLTFSDSFNGSENVVVTYVVGGLAGVAGYQIKSRTVVQQGTTSYTIPTGTRALLVQAIGAGGAGGGAATAAASAGAGGGGGSGGYAESFITSLPASPVTVAVGTGGTAGTAGNNAGNNGGDTTFNTTTVVGKGGTGGGGSAASSTIGNGGVGGAGGVSGTGDVTTVGEPGEDGDIFTGLIAKSGAGGQGSGPHGGGGAIGKIAAGAGGAGGNYGGGGAGGVVLNNSAAVAGGAGANGLLVITEYV